MQTLFVTKITWYNLSAENQLICQEPSCIQDPGQIRTDHHDVLEKSIAETSGQIGNAGFGFRNRVIPSILIFHGTWKEQVYVQVNIHIHTVKIDIHTYTCMCIYIYIYVIRQRHEDEPRG